MLEEILPPLYDALRKTALQHEVIISDDCSTDESVPFLKNNYSEIILVENAINKGFAPTINQGIFRTRFDFVLLLNSDVKLTVDYFKPLLQYFDLPDTFGVMGRIIDWNGHHIQDGGKYPHFHGAKIKTSGNYVPLEPATFDRFYSIYLSGANAFVSRQKLIDIGGFDELFAPFYVEDYELSLRAWRLGYKCYYEHSAICRHKVSVSIKSSSKKNYVNKIYYRNKMFLHAIHLPKSKLLLWQLQTIVEALLQFVMLRFYYVSAVKLFYENRKAVNSSRQRLQNMALQNQRLLDVKEVTSIVTESLKSKNIRKF